MIIVLDAGAIIAHMRDEMGADKVEEIMTNPGHTCYVHAINLCEVYYDAHRTFGEPAAIEILNDLSRMGVITNTDLSRAFLYRAGRIKAVHRRVSLADCFAIALAQSLNGNVLTCDHHEFDAVAAANLCPVTFIR
jgi:PIN domain nuclease of toxin-antitoxin system